MTPDERHVWFVVWPQSFSGLMISGLFYGWGALTEAINTVYNPENPRLFANQHGTFSGVIILVLGVMPMPLVRWIIQNKLLTEFEVQALGMVLTAVGLVMGGIALQFAILPLLYIGCAVPCGFGVLFVYQRLVFIHQLWFNRIGKYNLGAGVFGFGIGAWTVFFFAISVPILSVLPVHSVLYVYAAFCIPSVLYPLLTSVDVDKTNLMTQAAAVVLSTGGGAESSRTAKIEFNSSSEKGSASESTKSLLPAHSSSATTMTTRDLETGDIELLENKLTTVNGESMTARRDNHHNELQRSTELTSNGLLDESKENISTGGNDDESSETNDVTDAILLKEAALYDIHINHQGEYDLTFSEICHSPQTWILTVFFTAVLTPGWGIKLASIAMLTELFSVSPSNAALITSLYVTAYALGRLFSGFLAEADILIICSIALLVATPQTAVYLPHGSYDSSGCKAFATLLCFIGIMYGGCLALFYSIVFDVFGARNYRAVFSVAIFGFGFAVMVGGLSSSYSFSEQPHQVSQSQTVNNATNWFYVMAGGCVFAWFCLHTIRPFDYTSQLRNRIAILKIAHGDRTHTHSA